VGDIERPKFDTNRRGVFLMHTALHESEIRLLLVLPNTYILV